MTSETILTNAALVLPTEVVAGTLVIRAGRIAEIQPGRSHAPAAIDLGGDHLMPGVVDVHTDNLERQVEPRASARWPSRSAMIAHDAQCAAAGVTTVLDALCLGDLGFDKERVKTFRDAVVDLDALVPTGLLKSDHYLHLRCELPAVEMMELVDPVADHPLVRMVSLMDHSPGVGQYANMDRYWALRRRGGLRDEEIQARIDHLLDQRARTRTPNRRALLKRVAHLDIELASHDDRTEEEIAENIADGIRISEFPVSMVAANAARAGGMEIIAGAPNIVRGGSHSGNIAAADLVRAGRVDAFASDYVPAALVESAWLCVAQTGITLPEAVGYITDKPARMSRLPDRGRLEPTLRADLVRVHAHEGQPIVMQVWRGGERVA
jgi:alpha-D-ribose 1-methylphosphonate 5-triphosphate diphosphatase